MVVLLLALILLALLFGATSVLRGVGTAVSVTLLAVWYGGLAVFSLIALKACFA